jgi:hypothetical protein
VPRLLVLLASAGATALLAAGCGEGDEDRAARPVQLRLVSPADAAVTDAAGVRVDGEVAPARARVMVLGRPVAVTDGRFSVVVPLHPGGNVIDVGASAPRARAAWTALRVTRRALATVPDLVGLTAEEARAALEARELVAAVEEDDGLLDALLPGDPLVCRSSPAAGAEVPVGRTVDVVVSKSC